MISNLEKYKGDLVALVERGNKILYGLIITAAPQITLVNEEQRKLTNAEIEKFRKDSLDFKTNYQAWYSEAKALVRQLLPDRVDDFARLYERPKTHRKEITFENYTIEDALHGLRVTRGWEKDKIVGADAAIPRFQQQLAIVTGAKQKFQSSLFDIRQLLQADLFDSEIEAAAHLLKNRYNRAAGALAGVVLERHLGTVVDSHKVQLRKKDPSISELNDALKNATVVDTAQWRFIQHLGDIRNLCDHSKTSEPSAEQVQDLISGVGKILKTVL